MKVNKILASAILLASMAPCFSDNPLSNSNSQQVQSDMEELIQRFTNLGSYLGFNLQVDPTDANKIPASQTLFNTKNPALLPGVLITTFLGARPVNTALIAGSIAMSFVPSGSPQSSQNNIANATYTTSPGQPINTFSPLIDQQPQQKDPVSQSVFNILATPGFKFCPATSSGISNCLFRDKITANVIGTIPGTTEFANFQSNPPAYLADLNVNSLLGPLLYTTTPQQTSKGNEGAINQGLIAVNQMDSASDFIRYATAAVSPLQLADHDEYDSVYGTTNDTQHPELQLKAQETLNNYLTSLRIYSAQTSIGISNLYYIFAKRLPQTPNVGGQTAQNPTSQALTEFTMATHRLMKESTPNSPNNTATWIEQINTGSSASVQKEMALLLAEINYQLYLNRQQEERILLTNSVMLLMNARQNPPDTTLSVKSGASATN